MAPGFWYLKLVTTFTGLGMAPVLVLVPYSVWVLGEVLLLLHLLEFKGLALMSHVSQPVIALDLGLISSPLDWVWFWLFWSVLFQLPFCLWGLWLLVLAFWLLFLWPWFDPCHGGLCGSFWAYLTALIKESNCYCISTHFAQRSQVGALGSALVFPLVPNEASLIMPDLEAQEWLGFCCSCSPSAFLAACIKTI